MMEPNEIFLKIVTEVWEDYFWVIGLALLVIGVTKFFDNALGILILGIVLTLIGVSIKTIRRTNELK